jgi:hypothetical protein
LVGFTAIATLLAHGTPELKGDKRQQQETTVFEHLGRLWAGFYLSLSMGPVD